MTGIKGLQRLYRRQFGLVLLAFVGIVFAFAWLMKLQVQRQQVFYRQELAGDFQERVDMFKRLLEKVQFIVRTLRYNAQDVLNRNRPPQGALDFLPSFACLVDNKEGNFYYLDKTCLSQYRRPVFSLTGRGSVRRRSIDFYREINMALGLSACLKGVRESISEVTWAYYVSANRFITIYPWIDPGEFKYSDVLLEHDFFRLGTPRKNPDRKVFWTRVYRDEAGQGLMITCAAPVYDSTRFAGTVAADLTVDYLNGLLRGFRGGRGQLFVVNDHGQLVAHPSLIHSNSTDVPVWKSVLPKDLEQKTGLLSACRAKGPLKIGNYLCMRSDLGFVPWTVYYLEPYPVLGGDLFRTLGVGVFFLLILAVSLSIGVYILTYRWFVAPARKFVSYFLSQGVEDEQVIARALPGDWKRWFGDLVSFFAERRALEEQLKEQNMRLEEKVLERTRSLQQEVEERKKIEQELKQSEEKFFKAFHSIPILAAITSLDEGQYVEVNDLFVSATGYQRSEIIGKSVFDVHFFENPDMHHVIRKILADRGRVGPLETRYLTKAGDVRECIYTAECIEIGNKRHLLSTGFDVTYLKQTEQALKESEAKFRSVAETCPIGIAMVHGLKILYVNRTFEDMTGFGRAELLRMNILELVKPSDRALIVDYGRKRVHGSRDVFRYELQFITKQGEERWCEVVTSPSDFARKDRAIVSVLDITERKKAEDALKTSEVRYRAIFETAGAGLYLFDHDLFVIRANTALEVLLGCPRQEIEGRILSEFFAPDMRDKVADLSRQVLQGEDINDFQFRMLTKYGEVRHVLFKAGLLPGTRTGVASVLDFTNLIRVEKEKEILKENLLHAQKMESLGVLTSGIAHEFNNLLQGLFASVEMILQSPDLDPGLREHVKRIETVGSRSKSLVHGLLDFSRKSKFEFSLVDLNRVVQSALDIFRPALPKSIEVEVDLAPDLPAMFGDAKRLEQVVINLLSNARDAVRILQHGKIQITTGCVDTVQDPELGLKEGEYLFLFVQDNGQGVAPEISQKIFDPFFSTKDVGQGTGLGLSMVYGIVKEHGGVIDFKSRPGQGTRIEVYFPVQEDAVRKEVSVLADAGQKDAATPHSNVILLVDDEQMVRDVVSEGLQDTGFQVMVAEDGLMALEIYKEHGDLIDLVILDLGMPKMGGEQCLREIKKINKNAKILVSSGYINHEMTKRPEDYGIVGFLKKPYRFSEIIEKIREVLD